MSMSDEERDKKIRELANQAASNFLHPYDVGNKHIGSSPETFLQYSIPYLTVLTLEHQENALARHEKALKSLEADSRWIKFLTVVLVALTIVLAYYARRLDTVIHSLQETPPAATSSPTASPVTH
jgi:hypothetical protein